MSSCLWATEAARRKRKPALFPGTARFNALELYHGVQRTHEGVVGFEQQIAPLASDANMLIDLINEGDKEKVFLLVDHLHSVDLDKSMQMESSIDDSSRPWSSGGSATPEARRVKHERYGETLALADAVRSEVAKESLGTVLQNESHEIDSNDGLEEEIRIQPVVKTEAQEEAVSPLDSPERLQQNVANAEPPKSLGPQPVLLPDSPSMKVPLAQMRDQNENKQTEERFEDRNQNVPYKDRQRDTILPSKQYQEQENEQEENPPNDDAHGQKSPPDPSVKRVNIKEHPNNVPIKMEDSDSEVSDTSFQAISSAIRKSFAGKVSMGNSDHTAPHMTPGLAKGDQVSFPGRLSVIEGQRIKKESDERSGELQIPYNNPSTQSASRSTRLSKRTSVFVSLPSREPISYLSNKRHSIKVKLEESENKLSANSGINKALRQANLESNSSLVSKIPQHSKPSHSGRSTTVGNLSKAHDLQQQELSTAVSDIPDGKDTLSRSATISNRPNSLISSASPTKNSSPLYAASMRSKSKPGSSQGSRTTDFGSPKHGPPRLATSERRPRSRSRSPVKALQRNSKSPQKSPTLDSTAPLKRQKTTSPEKVPQLSSAPSSRSPTRYGTRDERMTGVSGRYSVATSTSASTPGDEKNSHARATTDSSATKQKVSKEKRSQNKFLTTTLNPQNPPKFNPVKTKIKNPSPIKRFLDTDAEKERLELKERRLRMNEFEANKVSLQPSTAETGTTSGFERRPPSPPKRDAHGIKRESLPPKNERYLKKAKKPVVSEAATITRRKAVGNAQPLPDAARGRFVRDRARQDKSKQDTTPVRSANRGPQPKSPVRVGVSTSPAIMGDTLPEIPSDEESLKKNKYFKTWANTPELQKIIQGNQDINPVDIFGTVSDLRMDEVFKSTKAEK